jgi:predicted nucleic acid-binding protein
VNLFVDTSVWSLALRRDGAGDDPSVQRLREALEGGEGVFTTGLVLQELLQGFQGPKARDAIVERFASLPFLAPDRTDHIDAAASKTPAAEAGSRWAPSTPCSPSCAFDTTSSCSPQTITSCAWHHIPA